MDDFEKLYNTRTEMYDEVVEELGEAKDKIKELEQKLSIAVSALQEIGKGKLSLDATLVANEALTKIKG